MPYAYAQHAVNGSRVDRRRCHSTLAVHTTALQHFGMLTRTELTRLRNDFIKPTACV